MTYRELQTQRQIDADRKAIAQSAKQIEQSSAHIDRLMRYCKRKLDLWEHPDLPERELAAAAVKFAMAEQRAGRKCNYDMARQQVASKPAATATTPTATPAKLPGKLPKPTKTSHMLAEAAKKLALDEAQRGNRISFEAALERVVAMIG